MNTKVVGIIVLVLCIVISLVILAMSNIKITKKDKTDTTSSTSTSQTVSTTELAEGTEDVSSVSSTEIPEVEQSGVSVQETDIPAVLEETFPRQEETAEAVPTPTQAVNIGDVMLQKVVEEDRLDYSQGEQSTTGVISNKECFLLNDQIIYCIDIDASLGTYKTTVRYYCTYNTYNAVSVGDALVVKYTQTTPNTYAVLSVSK